MLHGPAAASLSAQDEREADQQPLSRLPPCSLLDLKGLNTFIHVFLSCSKQYHALFVV